MPRGSNSKVGVISEVDVDVSDDILVRAISAPGKLIHVHRLGTPSIVKIVFAEDSLLSNLEAGLVRLPV